MIISTATRLSSGVMMISASIRGRTSCLVGLIPSTRIASISSRTLRAPRSAVIAVPPTPATTIAVAQVATSRTAAVTNTPPARSAAPSVWKTPPASTPMVPKPKANTARPSGRMQRTRIRWDSSMNSPNQW